jgi:quinol monooxygenase YgiN
MTELELHAHLKIRPGKLEEFKQQAAECVRVAREVDTRTIRYDWFISHDGTQCEVHEVSRELFDLVDAMQKAGHVRVTWFDFVQGLEVPASA